MNHKLTCKIQSYKTTRRLEDNIGENLDDLGYDNDFLGTIPRAQSMKEILDNLDFIKIRNFCSAKDSVKWIRRQATDWEKIFAKDISDKRLIQNMQSTLKVQQ